MGNEEFQVEQYIIQSEGRGSLDANSERQEELEGSQVGTGSPGSEAFLDSGLSSHVEVRDAIWSCE